MHPLDHIRIVLIETSHPGNIGAAARAMKTMGLADLRLVRPKLYPNAEATARASGADDLLARARVHENLHEALEGCSLVYGTSARPRTLRWEMVDPRAGAGELATSAVNGPVALLFGRERSGLSNEELDLCHKLVMIPANPDYSSLNLAAAVQILAYELRVACGGGLPAEAEPDPVDLPADAASMERFYVHLEETLAAIAFLDPANPRHLMRRLRRLYSKARPTVNELNILRGILGETQKRIRK